MESVPLLGILSSWEFIVACLLLIFLLPLVFAVASTRSTPRRPAVPARGRKATGASVRRVTPRTTPDTAPDEEP